MKTLIIIGILTIILLTGCNQKPPYIFMSQKECQTPNACIIIQENIDTAYINFSNINQDELIYEINN